MSKTKFEVGKEYPSRDGSRMYRVVSVNYGKSRFPIAAMFKSGEKDKEYFGLFTKYGYYNFDSSNTDLRDMVLPKKTYDDDTPVYYGIGERTWGHLVNGIQMNTLYDVFIQRMKDEGLIDD